MHCCSQAQGLRHATQRRRRTCVCSSETSAWNSCSLNTSSKRLVAATSGLPARTGRGLETAHGQ